MILRSDLVLHRIVENLAVGADQRCTRRVLQVAELLDIASAEVIDAVGEVFGLLGDLPLHVRPAFMVDLADHD